MRKLYELTYESISCLNLRCFVTDATESGKRFQLLTTLHARLFRLLRVLPVFAAIQVLSEMCKQTCFNQLFLLPLHHKSILVSTPLPRQRTDIFDKVQYGRVEHSQLASCPDFESECDFSYLKVSFPRVALSLFTLVCSKQSMSITDREFQVLALCLLTVL